MFIERHEYSDFKDLEHSSRSKITKYHHLKKIYFVLKGEILGLLLFGLYANLQNPFGKKFFY